MPPFTVHTPGVPVASVMPSLSVVNVGVNESPGNAEAGMLLMLTVGVACDTVRTPST